MSNGRMRYTIHKNDMPPTYATWRQVQAAFSQAGNEADYYEMTVTDHILMTCDMYRMDADYIKARCFDEIEPYLPTVGEVGYYIGLEDQAHYNPWGQSLQGKLKAICLNI